MDSVSGERKVPGDKVYGTVEADDQRAKELARNGLIELKPAEPKGGTDGKSGKPASSKPADK
ncbi:hypothetical protein DEIPH_ctg041orf0004 [Deinococcus phoenicis]|uniref:Uncharacterized protein n=1 Tax=Deinococcus phoenicis TaxID=1476583 RepID=A0A016QNQ7_9DEIO|nr:hypothetical protein DEIPH_ctg041orf0004 [Deinococcus phoenicis]